MSTEPHLWHEKLDVYQRSLALYSRAEESILSTSPKLAAVDHLDRALESILENLASGNSSWSIDSRRQQFGVAYGSALECAACLDILRVRGALPPDSCEAEKRELCRIVQMLIGLIRSDRPNAGEVREGSGEWETEAVQEPVVLFAHERLRLPYLTEVEVIPFCVSEGDSPTSS
jgi:four helix bundle protein